MWTLVAGIAIGFYLGCMYKSIKDKDKTSEEKATRLLNFLDDGDLNEYN